MKKIIIDTDPGIDDFMAIAMALESEELEVIGLTTVFGNTVVKQGAKNALNILELFELDIPVATGAASPLLVPWYEEGGKIFHGEDGVGNLNWSDPKGSAVEISAAQFIVEQAQKTPGELSLITLGPLTNLALALKLEPELPKLLKSVVVMGGAVASNGNATPAAEFNILNDPHAADMVMTAGFYLTLVGLDVTHEVIAHQDFFENIKNGTKCFSKDLFQASQKYQDSYKKFVRPEGVFLHDPTAIAYFLRPDFFKVQEGAIRVITDGMAMGQTLMDFRGNWEVDNNWSSVKKVKAATSVSGDEVKNFIEKLLK